MSPQSTPLNILLADDDIDDCLFFDKALKEIPINTCLTIVRNGEQLINYLSKNYENLPVIVFLDSSMPRKTGFECLQEIKQNEKLKDLNIVMLSTAFPQNIKPGNKMPNTNNNLLANKYLVKPNDFKELKKSIEEILTEIKEN